MRMIRRLARPLGRAWSRYPTASGVLIAIALAGGWFALAPPGAPPPFTDGWMTVLWIAASMVVVIVARARGGKDDDDWSS